MGVDCCTATCIAIGAVIAIIPIIGIIGLMNSERQRITDWDGTYFRISGAYSKGLSKANLGLLIINFLTIIVAALTGWKTHIAAFLAAGVFFLSGLPILVISSLRLVEQSGGNCLKMGLESKQRLLDAVTAGSPDVEYDLVYLSYVIGSNQHREILDKVGDWVRNKCSRERDMYKVWFGCSMVAYIPLVAIPCLIILGLIVK